MPKIILETDDTSSQVTFDPNLEENTFVEHVNAALNCIPNLLLQLYAHIPLLRPACAEEQMNHVYVFNEGDKGKVENDLYKYRKHIYDATVSVFSQVLTTAFPDVEYIDRCRFYQQEYINDHTKEEVAEYTAKIEEVTNYVRTNFEDIIKSMVEEENVQE